MICSRSPALAETLRAIARHGAKAFYEGPIAADMVATLRARGGLHTEEDFAGGLRNAEFVEPITLNWHGYDVFQCPPNGQGLVALMILGILDGLKSAGDGPFGALRYHRHIEAARLAYRDRDAFVADPAQADVPVKKLLSAEYLGALRGLISDSNGACGACRRPARRCCRRTRTRSTSAWSTRTATRAASSTRCSRGSDRRSWPSDPA